MIIVHEARKFGIHHPFYQEFGGNKSNLKALLLYSFALVIARPEPENSILELVKAFSAKSRGMPLVMLGNYDRKKNSYHSTVISATSNEVLFPGTIYDKFLVEALRFHTSLYIHGHTVGGTNPSLVEALGAESPVLAHGNKFTRWVAGPGAYYFQGELECANRPDVLLGNEVELAHMRNMSRARFREAFTWDQVLVSYEKLLGSWCA